MTETLYRSFSPDIEVRSSGDGRTLVGIAVPYGKPQRINAQLTEQFARGAFNHAIRAANRVPLAREHMSLGGTLIGRLTELRDDAAGLYFEARVSKTPTGDETLALLADGALQDVSVGFRERQNRRVAGGVIERTTADLRELAVVMEGAYGSNAVVAEVRRAGEHSPVLCERCAQADVVEHARRDEASRILAGLPVLPAAV